MQWRDIDFGNGTASVTKGIVKGHLGEVKTEVSKKLVPLHAYQLEDLKAWRAVAPYAIDDDWVFASHVTKGERPYWPDMILKHHIKPLAKKLGIKKRIGWHTFRRSFCIDPQGERRGREGGAGAVPPRESERDARAVCAGVQ